MYRKSGASNDQLTNSALTHVSQIKQSRGIQINELQQTGDIFVQPPKTPKSHEDLKQS